MRPGLLPCPTAPVAAGVAAVILLHAGAATFAQAPPVHVDVALVARATRPGEAVRVEVACTCGGSIPRATAFGRDIPLARSPDGTLWQGLVGIDVDVEAGTYPLVVYVPALPPVVREVPLHVQPHRFPTRTLTVAPEFVDPPAEVVDRIVSEASLLNRLFEIVTPRTWNRSVSPPLGTRPTPNFGSRSVFNGQPRSPHAGVDFRSPSGTAVTAPGAGTVVVARDLYFTGNTVVVDHGGGLYSLLAHLSSMTVGEGDVVDRGARLGRVGATGRATGPHLHWGVRLNGARVDPLSVIAATEGRPGS